MQLTIEHGGHIQITRRVARAPGPPRAFYKVEHRLDGPGKRAGAYRKSISPVPCPACLGQGVAECCSLRKAPWSERPFVRGTVVEGGRRGYRVVMTVTAVILYISFTPRTTLVDEDTASEEGEHRRAEAPKLINSDVRFPLPGAGWQVEGPFRQTEAEADPGAEWRGSAGVWL